MTETEALNCTALIHFIIQKYEEMRKYDSMEK